MAKYIHFFIFSNSSFSVRVGPLCPPFFLFCRAHVRSHLARCPLQQHQTGSITSSASVDFFPSHSIFGAENTIYGSLILSFFIIFNYLPVSMLRDCLQPSFPSSLFFFLHSSIFFTLFCASSLSTTLCVYNMLSRPALALRSLC